MGNRTRASLLAGIVGVTVFLLASLCVSLLIRNAGPPVGLVLGVLSATAIYRRVLI